MMARLLLNCCGIAVTKCNYAEKSFNILEHSYHWKI